MQSVLEQAQATKKAWRILRRAEGATKNIFLNKLEVLLRTHADVVLAANKKDLAENPALSSSMRRRLLLSESSMTAIADGVRAIAELPDPVGEVIESRVRPDGLRIERVRLPIGVIAAIFESRPNIIIDIAALAVKSGNAAIVRGGKEARYSNDALYALITESLEAAGLPRDAIQQLDDRRHEAVGELVKLDAYIDLAIPRGGEALVRNVLDHARVPVIHHMRGLCHLYIDEKADIEKAIAIAVNAKTSNPATCNSVESILVHAALADKALPRLTAALHEHGVEIHGCPRTCAQDAACIPATEDDWATEYLDLKVSMKVVNSFEEAVAHIERYSSGLTDGIVAEDLDVSEKFLRTIDSACVLVNASNRLVDGAQFGLGGEIGISTSRIHMRGPMGLADLTTPAYRVRGTGHLRT